MKSKSVAVSLSRSTVDLGKVVLDYALGLSISLVFMRVKAFSEVSIPVSIENRGSEEETVTVSVEAPEGWDAGVYYDSAEVVNLTLSQGSVQNLNLKIRAPYGSQGLYSLTVRVSGSTVQEKSVSLYVEEADLQILTSTYPIVQTTPGSTISFDLTVKNVLMSRFTGTIFLEVPNGWTGSIVKSDGSSLYGLSLEPGGFVNAKVKVDVPTEEDSGNYVVTVSLKTKDFDSTLPLNITVVKGVPKLKLRTDTPYVDAYAGNTATYPIEVENTGESVDRLNLGLGVLGWYSVSYVTQNFYCESTAGESIVFQVEVKNTGYSSLSNLKLETSDIPNGFNVKVDPNLVPLLKPQENAVFSITITSDADISAGDYYITLSLKADQSQTTARSLHVYVKQRGEALLIGALIAVVMIGALILIYHRYGRR
ncbi:MAG: NEW3 domain-containing protein [Thermoproteota archaeon]